jgi:hypothetical protein
MLSNQTGQSDFEMAVFGVLEAQLELYPLLSLRDVYKSFFQDAFGPGHLLCDQEKARADYKEELGAMRSRGRRTVEPCGMGVHFCRVPLDLVLDGILEEKRYFSSFLAGASEFSVIDLGVWKEKWCHILEALQLRRESICNFSVDSEYILKALEIGMCAMSHSGLYRELYDPHYRIFSLEQQQKLMQIHTGGER